MVSTRWRWASWTGRRKNPKNKALPDLTRRELLLLVPLLVLIVWIGVYPQPFLNLMAPAVNALAANLDAAAVALAGAAARVAQQVSIASYARKAIPLTPIN